MARIFDREGWLHDRWRSRKGVPRYSLAAPAMAGRALNVWRLPPKDAPSGSGASPLALDDPSQRTLDRVIEALESKPDAFQ